MAQVEELYLYLPSAVKSVVIENTISHYTTLLKAPVQLSPEYSYEAALLKVIYPSNVYNVYSGHLSYYSYTLKTENHTRIAEGVYYTPDDVMKALAYVLGHDQANYLLSIDKRSRKFQLELKPPPKSAVTPFMKLSKNLQVITGLPDEITKEGITSSAQGWDMSGGVQNIYCYCDLLQNVNIGDTHAPVLCVLAYKPGLRSSQVEYSAQNPIYTPINKTLIEEITIEFRTKVGDYVPFITGEAMVLIHIRPKLPRL